MKVIQHQSGEGITDPRLVYLVSQRDPTQGSVFPSSVRQSPVEVLKFRGEGLSSSLMREQLSQGTLPTALPQALQKFIQSNGLYSCEQSLKQLSKTQSANAR